MTVGKAYGFLQYSGKNRDLVRAFPAIVKRENFPQSCTFSLLEIAAFKTEDSALARLVEEARECDRTHILEGSIDNSSNRKAAMFVGDIFNGVYMTLFNQGDPFSAEIVYQRAGRYVFRRK